MEGILLQQRLKDNTASFSSSSTAKQIGDGSPVKDKLQRMEKNYRSYVSECLREEKEKDNGLSTLAIHQAAMSSILPTANLDYELKVKGYRRPVLPKYYRQYDRPTITSAMNPQNQAANSRRSTLHVSIVAKFADSQVPVILDTGVQTPMRTLIEDIILDLEERLRIDRRLLEENLSLDANLGRYLQKDLTVGDYFNLNFKTANIELNFKVKSKPMDAENSSWGRPMDEFLDHSRIRPGQESRLELEGVTRMMAEDYIPKLTKPGYSIKPSMQKLKEMSLEELRHVFNFTIWNEYGEAFFPGETDLTYVNLDLDVDIQPHHIEIYPDDKSCGVNEKPRIGEKLNKPTELTLKNIRPKKSQSIETYVASLKKKLEEMDSKLLSYDDKSGRLSFQVPHFTKYAFDNVDDGATKETEDSRPPTNQSVVTVKKEPKRQIQNSTLPLNSSLTLAPKQPEISKKGQCLDFSDWNASDDFTKRELLDQLDHRPSGHLDHSRHEQKHLSLTTLFDHSFQKPDLKKQAIGKVKKNDPTYHVADLCNDASFYPEIPEFASPNLEAELAKLEKAVESRKRILQSDEDYTQLSGFKRSEFAMTSNAVVNDLANDIKEALIE